MKTIKNEKTGELKRLNDREAEKLVSQSFSGWKYSSKTEWKSENRKESSKSKQNTEDDTTNRKNSASKTKKSASR